MKRGNGVLKVNKKLVALILFVLIIVLALCMFGNAVINTPFFAVAYDFLEEKPSLFCIEEDMVFNNLDVHDINIGCSIQSPNNKVVNYNYVICITEYSSDSDSNIIVQDIKLSNIKGDVLFEQKSLNTPIELQHYNENLDKYIGSYESFRIPINIFEDSMTYFVDISLQLKDMNGNLGKTHKLKYKMKAIEYAYCPLLSGFYR